MPIGASPEPVRNVPPYIDISLLVCRDRVDDDVGFISKWMVGCLRSFYQRTYLDERSPKQIEAPIVQGRDSVGENGIAQYSFIRGLTPPLSLLRGKVQEVRGCITPLSPQRVSRLINKRNSHDTGNVLSL